MTSRNINSLARHSAYGGGPAVNIKDMIEVIAIVDESSILNVITWICQIEGDFRVAYTDSYRDDTESWEINCSIEADIVRDLLQKVVDCNYDYESVIVKKMDCYLEMSHPGDYSATRINDICRLKEIPVSLLSVSVGDIENMLISHNLAVPSSWSPYYYRFIDAAQVCLRYRISLSTLWRRRKAGIFPEHAKREGRKPYWCVDDLRRYDFKRGMQS